MSRQRGWLFALIGVSLALSWYFARQGVPSGPTPRAQCLASSQCQSTERCVIVPRSDGFATFGQCGELCTDDASCPNGWSCRSWVEDKGSLSPERGQAAAVPRVKVCMHHTVQ